MMSARPKIFSMIDAVIKRETIGSSDKGLDHV